MTCRPDRPHSRNRLLAGLAALALLAGGAGQAAPPGGDGPLAAARQALARGDGVAAEVRLRDAMARGASREQVSAAMGEAYLAQGNLPKAREWLADGAFAPGTEAQGWRMLGRLERLENDFAAASRAYDQALRHAPKDSGLWVDIGRLRYAGGEQLQAVEAAEHAVRLDPGNVRALEFRAQLVRDQYGMAAALPWLEAALLKAPADLSLLGEYAGTLGELGRATDMLAVTRQMLAIDRNNARAWFLQAALAARAGKAGLARALLGRAGDALRDVPAAMLLQGALEMEAGSPGLAIATLDRLLTRQPGNAQAQVLLARAYARAGRNRELVARFGPHAAGPDASPYLLTLVGRAYEELGQRDLAAGFLDRAAALPAAFAPITQPDPQGLAALRWRDSPGAIGAATPYVRQLLAARRFAEAQGVAERVRADSPGLADAQALAGDVQLMQGRGDDALARYGMAARVRMGESLLVRMVGALRMAGRGEEASRLVAGYLVQSPASPVAARLAANALAQAGAWAQTRRILENLRARGGARDPRLLADLAIAQLRTGDGEAAEETARAAYRLQRMNPLATQAYGIVLAERGERREQAAALLEKARKLGGDNPVLAAARAGLARQ